MGALSANTLFHFTKTKECLIDILEYNFSVRYCVENFHYAKEKVAVPMVCFCDIPLAQISNHVDEFGSYALGLNKDWAIRNNISPVIYTLENTNLDSCIKEIYTKFHDVMGGQNGIYSEGTDIFFRLSSLIKEYEGVSLKTRRDKKFYDEREWRYILPKNSMCEHPFLFGPEIDNIDAYNDSIDFQLKFTPDDISYIIVKNEYELSETAKSIREIKGRNFTSQQVDLLTTRIISMERIKEDF